MTKQNIFYIPEKILKIKIQKTLTPRFTLQEVLKAIVNRKQILLIKVNAEINKDKKRIIIEIPENTIVATTPEERKYLELKAGPWRWPAGGLALILNLKDVSLLLTVLRDKKAPSYANYDTLGCGVGATLDEILFPLHCAIREGLEEFIIATPDGIIMPNFQSPEFNVGALTAVNLQIIDALQGLPSLFKKRKLVSIKAEFIVPRSPEYYLTISYENLKLKKSIKASVVFDPPTNGIDVLKILRIDLPKFKFNQIAVLDGETDINEKHLNRLVNCYEIKDNKITGRIYGAFHTGQKIKPAQGVFPYPLAPILKKLIEDLY